MKRISIVILLLMLGCGTLRKEETLLKNNSEENLGVQKKQVIHREWNGFTSDSLFSETKMVLWPKGTIKISSAGKLEGEIDKIQILNKQLQQRRIVENMLASQSKLSHTHYQKAQQKELNQVSQSRNANKFLWCCLGLSIFGFLIFWCLNKT